MGYGISLKGLSQPLHHNIADDRNKSKRIEAVRKDIEKNDWHRNYLRGQYKYLVKVGKLRPPTRKEELIKISEGHEDLESTRAAKKVVKEKI